MRVGGEAPKVTREPRLRRVHGAQARIGGLMSKNQVPQDHSTR